MMLWEMFMVLYLGIGVFITACASLGHKKRYGYPLHWSMYLPGMFVWPFVLLIGGRK